MWNVDYLVTPNQSEIRTLNKYDLRATLFNQKVVSVSVFANFNQNFINRENLVSVKSKNFQWGGTFNYKNKSLPITASYQQLKWDQEEKETGRLFKNKQKSFQARASKSFTRNKDKNSLTYTRDEYFRQDPGLSPIINNVDNLVLTNSITFDPKKRYSFTSNISNYDQRGNIDFSRFQALENISLNLPKRIGFNGTYSYYDNKQSETRLKQHGVMGELSHQLFSSLSTNLLFEYNSIDQSTFRRFYTRTGIRLKYSKKIPKGNLMLNYSFIRRHEEVDSDPVPLQIFNEEHTLSDGRIELLERAFVILPTVVVKDVTQSIIYQLDFDYILIERGDFLEIQRIPGGLIANNQSIFIDYTAEQQGSYKYNSDNQQFSARVVLFERIIEIYFRLGEQDYDNLEFSELITLNFFSQRIYGSRITYGFFEVGFEYDSYQSNITPYDMARYYIRLHWRYRNKLLLSLNGNFRDIVRIDRIDNQQYLDITGRAAYSFNPQTKLNLDLGYRNQEGRQIELDMVTARTEFTTLYRQLYFTAGLELFRRTYVGEILNFNGAYFKVERKF